MHPFFLFEDDAAASNYLSEGDGDTVVNNSF